MGNVNGIHSGFTLAPDEEINLGESGKIVGLLNVDQNANFDQVISAVGTNVICSVPDLSSNIEDGDILRIDLTFYGNMFTVGGSYLALRAGLLAPANIVTFAIPSDGTSYVGKLRVDLRYGAGGAPAGSIWSEADYAAIADIGTTDTWVWNPNYGTTGPGFDMADTNDWAIDFIFVSDHANSFAQLHSMSYTLIKSDA